MWMQRRRRDNGRKQQSISLRLRRSTRLKGEQMKHSRRQFLRDSACGLTAAAMLSSLERLGLVNAMVQQQIDVAADYKALVCVFLSGGSDCNNMIIPFDNYTDPTGGSTSGYSNVRANSGLAVPLSALSGMKITPANNSGVAFALHPNLSPEVANSGQGPGLLGPWNQ